MRPIPKQMKRHAVNGADTPAGKCPKLDRDRIKDKIIWSGVLPYLELVDIESIAEAIDGIRDVIHTCLSDGSPLVIGSRTVVQYPPSSHKPLYQSYGDHATVVECRNLIEGDAHYLFPLLAQMHTLTTSGMWQEGTTYYDITFPDCLKNLRITGSIGDNMNLSCMFSDIRNLENVHLQDNGPFMISKAVLKSLVLIRQNIFGLLRGHCSVQSLTMDRIDRLPLQQLQHLELQSLRILQPVDPLQKAAIVSLDLPSMDVSYMHMPTEDDDTPILRLNEYCLLWLQRFLSPRDIVALWQSHPDFEEMPIPALTIDRDFADSPSFAEDISLVGPSVVDLVLDSVDNSDAKTALRCCPNIQHLHLAVHVDQELINAVPAGLRSLVLKISKRHTGFLDTRGMFRRLSPTLQKIAFRGTDSHSGLKNLPGLEELRHIEEFSDNSLLANDKFLQFLRHNRESLTKLNIKVFIVHSSGSFWTAVTSLSNLRTLQLTCDAEFPQLPSGILPQLHTLTLQRPFYDHHELLEALDGSRLKVLEVKRGPYSDEYKVSSEVASTLHKFVALEELNVEGIEEEELVKILPLLAQLKRIVLRCPEHCIKVLARIRSVVHQLNRKVWYNDYLLG